MTEDEIYGKLTPIFHDIFDDGTLLVRADLNANDVDEWDSLSHVRLMLTIAKQFGVDFSASEIAELQNVGELVTLLQHKTVK